jgi:hypothetical protein
MGCLQRRHACLGGMGKITQKEFVAAVREAGDTAYSGSVAY